jgi:alpha-glucoside transport system permease protein
VFNPENLKDTEPEGFWEKTFFYIKQIVKLLVVPVAAFAVLYYGFQFLQAAYVPQGLLTIVAVAWGVGGIWLVLIILNWMIQHLPPEPRKRVVPFLFVGPAILVLGYYIFLPTVRSLWMSFFDRLTQDFVGLANYEFIFSELLMALRNNVIWLFVGTALCVILGLIFALLTDRCRWEKISKSLIFLPIAISFVGAGVVWKFMYDAKPLGEPQIGFVNAIITALGGEPYRFLVIRPWNNIFLIVVLVWMYTGFSMVIFSASIKNVPQNLLESARIDGATELKIITSIIIPYIKSTVITVGTTILLITLKLFDIVYTMTGGRFGTEVLATAQYKYMFKYLHYGKGAAIAILIVLLVIPVMIYNLKQFQEREVF